MKRILCLTTLLFLVPTFVLAQDSPQTARKVVVGVTNASSTGTTRYRLAKLTGAPSKAEIVGTSDTDGAIGIVTANAGTSLIATIQVSGQVACDFDDATTAGDYVQISSTAAGKCHSSGSTYPTTGQVLGRVLSTNVGAGNYAMVLAPIVKAATATTAAGSDTQVQFKDGSSAFGGDSDFTFNKTTGLVTVAGVSGTGAGSTAGILQVKDDASGNLYPGIHAYNYFTTHVSFQTFGNGGNLNEPSTYAYSAFARHLTVGGTGNATSPVIGVDNFAGGSDINLLPGAIIGATGTRGSANDVGLTRAAPGVWEMNDATAGHTGALLLRGRTIATLPGTPVLGTEATVTDGDPALAWGATVVNSGAGATKYKVWYNGTNWTVVGK